MARGFVIVSAGAVNRSDNQRGRKHPRSTSSGRLDGAKQRGRAEGMRNRGCDDVSVDLQQRPGAVMAKHVCHLLGWQTEHDRQVGSARVPKLVRVPITGQASRDAQAPATHSSACTTWQG
jgi:hypothetical protein